MIPMRALVPLVHEGAPVRAGDVVEVSATTAAIWRYAGKADFATIQVQPTRARKSRTYKRRDLQAEP
jgi:hypothetical protein